MSKIIGMARLSAKGGFSLFLGVTLSTIISAVGTILVVRLLPPSEYALVAIAIMPSTLISLFRDWGVNFAMIKYIAQYRSENRTTEIKGLMASALLFESALGILLSIASFTLAGFLAANVFHRPETKNLIEIASLTILTGSFITAAQSTFTGYERMELNSLTMICQSALKTLTAPLLILLGYRAFGAVLASTISAIIACIVGLTLLYLILYRNIRKPQKTAFIFSRTLKDMLRYGLPLSLSTIAGGFLFQFYNFMMAIYCSDHVIGNYQAAVNFSMLISFFTMPIVTVLFPAFSKINPKREMKALRTVFQGSIKYASLLTIPVTAAIMVLSKPIVYILFGERYADTPLLLTLYAITYLYTGLGSLSLGSLLNGQGKTKTTMHLTLLNLSIGIPLSLILIPRFQIFGLVATILTAGIPSLTTGLWWIKRQYATTVEWTSSTRIYLASGLAATLTHLLLGAINSYHWIELITGGIIFLIAYIIAVPLIEALKKEDIENLKWILSELGPITRLLNIPLIIMEKLLTIFHKKRSLKPQRTTP